MAAPFAKASIGTSEAQLTAVATPVPHGIYIKALAANAVPVYVGLAGVLATTGYQLSAGAELLVPRAVASDASEIYLITASGTAEVRAWVV